MGALVAWCTTLMIKRKHVVGSKNTFVAVMLIAEGVVIFLTSWFLGLIPSRFS